MADCSAVGTAIDRLTSPGVVTQAFTVDKAALFDGGVLAANGAGRILGTGVEGGVIEVGRERQLLQLQQQRIHQEALIGRQQLQQQQQHQQQQQQ